MPSGNKKPPKKKGGKGTRTYLTPGQLPESLINLIRDAQVGE